MTDNETIELASRIAREAHASQKRRNGDPYITHVQRVAKHPNLSPLQRAAAWLHDVVEDTSWTIPQLREQGIPEYVLGIVDTLTKREDDNYFEFIMRIRNSIDATDVKIADIEDNLSDGLNEGSMKDKYRLALWILKDRFGY